MMSMASAAVSSELDELDEFVATRADTELPISRDEEQSGHNWDAVVNQLIEWADPAQPTEDGVDAPSRTTLELAANLMETLKKEGHRCPDRTTRDPNGGILFEYRHQGTALVFHVWDDGLVDASVFRQTELTHRVTILAPGD